MENVIQDNIMDDDTRDYTHNNEDTGLRKYLGQEVKMMEYDFENHSTEDHGSEHDGTGELFPFPGCKMDTTVVSLIIMMATLIMSMTRIKSMLPSTMLLLIRV